MQVGIIAMVAPKQTDAIDRRRQVELRACSYRLRKTQECLEPTCLIKAELPAKGAGATVAACPTRFAGTIWNLTGDSDRGALKLSDPRFIRRSTLDLLYPINEPEAVLRAGASQKLGQRFAFK